MPTLSHGDEKANEFKRYRQVLAALYFAIIALGFLLLAVSVVRELFFRPVAQLEVPDARARTHGLSAEHPLPGDLLRCHQEVLRLYRELDRNATRLISLSASGKTPAVTDRGIDDAIDAPITDTPVDVLREWNAFSREWMTQWERVNAWCRFSELEHTNMGEAYDRMARIHGELPAMRHKYQSLLIRFDDEQVAELSRIRREFVRSGDLLIRRSQGANEEQAP